MKVVKAEPLKGWQADCPYCAALCQFDGDYLADVECIVQCENCEKEFKFDIEDDS